MRRYWITIVLLLLLFFVRSIELSRVGETWDEIAKVRNGQLHIKALLTRDFTLDTWIAHKEHPPLGKILIAVPTYITTRLGLTVPSDVGYVIGKQYTLARATSLLFFIGTIYLTFLTATRLFGKNVGYLSAIFLSLFPHAVAHSYVASLESVQTFIGMLLIYFTLIKKRFSNKDIIFTGFLAGLALLTKWSSVLFVIFPIYYLYIVKRWPFKRYSGKIILYFLTAVTILYLAWPLLWADPINRVLISLKHFDLIRTEVFLGSRVQPPYYYYLVYFLITTPIPILIGYFMSLPKLVVDRDRSVLALNIFFLSFFLLSLSTFKQNGVRYLFPVFPVFLILSVYGWEYVINKMKKVRTILYSTLVGYLLLTNLSISPYYLDYYNLLVGGTKNVYKNRLAQIGWWGEGIKESVNYANKNFPKGSSICLRLEPRHVAPRFRHDLIIYDAELELYEGPNQYGFGVREYALINADKQCFTKDYLIVNTMFEWNHEYFLIPPGAELVHTIAAGNAPLVKIYRLK